MTKIDTDGEKAFNVFVDAEGNEVKEHISLEDYVALNVANPVNPTKEGCSWKGSFKTIRFSTASEELEDGQYANLDADNYLVKLPGCEASVVSKTKIIDGQLDPSIEEGIISCSGKELTIWQ